MAPARKDAKQTVSSKTPKKKKGGPDPMDIHVGARVRLRRMILGISQEKLGQALGVTFQQIQKYEKGINRIGAGRLRDLANLLKVPVQFFYDDYEDAAPGAATGMAESDAGGDFMEFINSPEGVELCRHFSSIDDPQVKKRVLDLVKTIAETEGRREKK